MANWIHRLLNPHCPHCIEERREQKFCQSCEDHKMEIARLHHENEKLLDRVLIPQVREPERTVAPQVMSPLPKVVPWAVKRQMLEAEDRERAKLLRNAPKPDAVEDVKDLERELGLAEQERENATKVI